MDEDAFRVLLLQNFFKNRPGESGLALADQLLALQAVDFHDVIFLKVALDLFDPGNKEAGAFPGHGVDGSVVGDKALKLGAGSYVVQVGKRKFARVTLA